MKKHPTYDITAHGDAHMTDRSVVRRVLTTNNTGRLPICVGSHDSDEILKARASKCRLFAALLWSACGYACLF